MQVTKEAIRQMAIRGEDVTQLDVRHLTDMSELFYDRDGWDEDGNYVSPLKDFSQDISEWDVSQVTNMTGMFYGCSSFNQDLSRWDVCQVTDMSRMFRSCSSFNQDLSTWDVCQVTDIWRMFWDCYSFNQDLSQWNVSHVTDMESMFKGCSSFNQDLSSWDVSMVTSMDHMFEGCSSLTHTMYWNLHPDCVDIPDQVTHFPLSCSKELKQKMLVLLKGYVLEEAINQVLADPSTSSKERYELLKFQQAQLSKELSSQEGNR